MSISVVSLNCNSLYPRLAEVKLLLYASKPTVMCLTETWAHDNFLPSFCGYSCLWRNRGAAGGGLCTLVSRSLCYREIVLAPYGAGVLEVQAVAIRMDSGSFLTILNLYNPNASVSTQELQFYVDQLSTPYLLTGDFNAHSPVLSSRCPRADASGRSLEQFLLASSAVLLNPIDFITYIDRRTGRGGCLDLVIASSDVAPYFAVERLRDVGSDHYPVRASSDLAAHTLESVPVPRWNVAHDALQTLSAHVAPSSLIVPASVDDMESDITSRLLDAAASHIPRSSGIRRNRLVSAWWSEACREAVRQRRQARRAVEHHPTRERLIEYRRCSALARNCVVQHKRAYRRKFLSSVTFTTPIGVAWRKVRLLRVRTPPASYPIVVNGQLLDSTLAKANLFCTTFQSSGLGGVTRVPHDLHRVIINSWSGNDDYNRCFTRHELEYALHRLRMTSPGEDGIHNAFLKVLSVEQYDGLLALFNQSFQQGLLPVQWKRGIVLPILKPGKDPSFPQSYRPITLLSCMGKLMERLVVGRLEYVVNRLSLMSQSQCGFRRGMSTLDVLLRLENQIRIAQSSGEVCLVVYVDLQSAFDKVWIDGLLYKLATRGIRGALARWLQAYLSSRTARVRLDGVLSDPCPLLAGVPQGAVLSPLLFNLMLMDVPFMEGVDIFMYADDITVCCRGPTVGTAKALMQRYLDTFDSFCRTWGLVVSPLKTVFQYFTHKRVRLPVLRYHRRVLTYEKSHRILGMVFDAPRLKWGPHISMLRTDIMRRIALLKHMASPNWGANRRFLRLFYCAYIRAKLDYGCILYRTACDSLLSRLDVLQNACLRLILGARRTTPILSLQAEANIPPLSLRRQYLAARMYIRVMYRSRGDATAAVVSGDTPMCLRDAPMLLSSMGVPRCPRRPPVERESVPPWLSLDRYVHTDFDLDPHDNLSILFAAHLDVQHSGSLRIFCDGSRLRDASSTASGLYVPSSGRAVAWKLSPYHSVLTSELYAIYQALKLVECGTALRWVICSDSLVALELILSPTGVCHDLVVRIRSLILELNQRRSVSLQWVKAHVGITGNEVADMVAKNGHTLDRSVLLRVPCSDVLALLRSSFRSYWELRWIGSLEETGRGSALASVRTGLSPVPWVSSHSRRVSVVLARFRMGHVGVRFYLHRFGMADSPACLTCGVDDTIEHFLLSCARYRRERLALVAALRPLGVSDMTVRILLGGGSYPARVQSKIIRATADFLTQTGVLSEL